MRATQRTHLTVFIIGLMLGSAVTYFSSPWLIIAGTIALLIPWPGQWTMLDNSNRPAPTPPNDRPNTTHPEEGR